VIPGIVAGAKRKLAADQHFSSVRSLLHLNSNFNDSSSGSWSGVGAPVVSAIEKKFGDGSLYLNGSSYLLRSAASMSLFGSVLTIELWVYKTTAADVGILFSASGAGVTLETIGGYIVIGKRNVTPVLATSNTTLPLNQWVHIAVVLDAPNTHIYQNGLLVASAANSNFATGDFQLGAYTSVSKFFTGYIDEFRYTQGVARYTANFTPPTAPFPDAGPTP
jgi:hypothetical protein